MRTVTFEYNDKDDTVEAVYTNKLGVRHEIADVRPLSEGESSLSDDAGEILIYQYKSDYVQNTKYRKRLFFDATVYARQIVQYLESRGENLIQRLDEEAQKHFG